MSDLFSHDFQRPVVVTYTQPGRFADLFEQFFILFHVTPWKTTTKVSSGICEMRAK
jgi:hypothetical protein